MTQAQFEANYARKCGLPPGVRARDWLREMCSLEAISCDCGDAGCPGWRMVAIKGGDHDFGKVLTKKLEGNP